MMKPHRREWKLSIPDRITQSGSLATPIHQATRKQIEEAFGPQGQHAWWMEHHGHDWAEEVVAEDVLDDLALEAIEQERLALHRRLIDLKNREDAIRGAKSRSDRSKVVFETIRDLVYQAD